MDKKPNILFLFGDQLNKYSLGCMGNSDVFTPILDELAKEGVLFTNAYSNSPLCTPYRINLFTGLYTRQTRTFANGSRIPRWSVSLADVFNEAGYETSYVGKWHIGGWGNTPVPRRLRGGFKHFIGYQCYNNYKKNVKFFDEQNRVKKYEGHRTDVTTDIAIERLQEIKDNPFLMFVSYQAPHYPVQPSPEFESIYKNIEVKKRPNVKSVGPFTRLWHRPSTPWPVQLSKDFRKYGKNLDEYIRLYYAMVSQLDYNIGRILDELERLGIADNTIIVFTSDHGDLQGSHGLKNKRKPFEESAGVPLIIKVPRGANGIKSDGIVSTVDFFPTFLDLAGLIEMEDLPGKNFAPILQGERMMLEGPVFSEMIKWTMVRYSKYKLVMRRRGKYRRVVRLYNLEEDPFELNNLARKKQYAPIRKELKKMIIDWKKQTRKQVLGTVLKSIGHKIVNILH